MPGDCIGICGKYVKLSAVLPIVGDLYDVINK